MHDLVDDRGVPISKGVPMAVRYAFVIGILAIFAMGYLTIIKSAYGHDWPAAKTLRTPLGAR